MAYDRSDWHRGGDYSEALPDENKSVQIGIFLARVVKNNLEGEMFKGSEGALDSLRKEDITGMALFEKECDEKLWEDDLNDEANAFAKIYCDKGIYLEDCALVLCGNVPSLYHVENTWNNVSKISLLITSRFNDWKNINVESTYSFGDVNE